MAVIERAAKVTAQGQTTVPAPIREALGIEAGDRIIFAVENDGSVSVRRTDEERDPAIGSFLQFLAKDIEQRPEAIEPLTASLEATLRGITAETVIDRENDRIRGQVGL